MGDSSEEGRNLFREALVEGTMENYFRLAEQFRTQDEPAFCGLSTLTMVLNALAVDPGRAWKGMCGPLPCPPTGRAQIQGACAKTATGTFGYKY